MNAKPRPVEIVRKAILVYLLASAMTLLVVAVLIGAVAPALGSFMCSCAVPFYGQVCGSSGSSGGGGILQRCRRVEDGCGPCAKDRPGRKFT